MKLNKNYRYILAGVLIIIFSALIVNALISGTKHSQTNILVDIDGKTMNLQEAINGNFLKDNGPAATAGTQLVSSGHLPSEILVSVDGSEMTLAAAIAGAGLCGSTSIPYTGSINPGHLASEIDIGSKTLQAAIDGGDFCVTYTYQYSGWSACGVCSVPTCGGGTCTKTRTCGKYANSVFVENVDCSNCGNVCSDSTTTCNTQSCTPPAPSCTDTCNPNSVTASCEYGAGFGVATGRIYGCFQDANGCYNMGYFDCKTLGNYVCSLGDNPYNPLPAHCALNDGSSYCCP